MANHQNFVVSLFTKGEPPDDGTDSNYYSEEGALTMSPTMPPIKSSLYSSPPICDDEATTEGEKPR